jgi:hypothetical protein
MDVVQEIMKFMPISASEKKFSCGKFISTMRQRYGSLDSVVTELRFSVVKTLLEFKRRLDATHFIKISAVQVPGTPTPEPMRNRVNSSIGLARQVPTAAALVDICKLIVDWKRESRLIAERLATLIRRLDTFIRTGVVPATFLQGVVVNKRNHSMHFRLEDPIAPLNPTHQPHTYMKKLRRDYRKRLEKDEAALPRLLGPINIS